MAQLPAMVKWSIWFALTSAVVTYFVILQVVDSGEANSGELKNPLYVAGLLSAIASLGAKHFVRSRSVKEGRVVPFADQAFIVALALAESSAIFGLVLGFQGAQMSDYLPLFAVSLVTFLMVNPRTFLLELDQRPRA